MSVNSPPVTVATRVGKPRLVKEKRALGAGALTATASLSQVAATTPHSPSRRTWTSPSPSSPALTSCVWSGTQWTPCRYAARDLGLCTELGGLTWVPGWWGDGLGRAAQRSCTLHACSESRGPRFLCLATPCPSVATFRHCLLSPLASHCSGPTPAPPLARALQPWCYGLASTLTATQLPCRKPAVCADTGGPASAQPPLLASREPTVPRGLPRPPLLYAPLTSPSPPSLLAGSPLFRGVSAPPLLHALLTCVPRCRDPGSADPRRVRASGSSPPLCFSSPCSLNPTPRPHPHAPTPISSALLGVRPTHCPPSPCPGVLGPQWADTLLEGIGGDSCSCTGSPCSSSAFSG